MSHPKTGIRLTERILRHIDLGEAVGVILFGSTAHSKADRLSDIDIAIFWNRNLNVYREVDIDGVRAELLWYPMKPLQELLKDGKLRDRRDTWIKACLWLNILRGGVILHDREGLMEEYREKALRWRWSRRELKLTHGGVEGDLEMAERLLEEGDNLKASLCLRDALNLLTVYRLMSRGDIPSFRPKELYRAAEEMGESYLQTYREAMGLNGETSTEEALNLCAEIHSRFRAWSPTTERAFREVLKATARGNADLALLSARHYALKALMEALERRDRRTRMNYFYSDTHLKLLEKARRFEDEILTRYLRLQSLGRLLKAGELKRMISVISGSYL